MHVDYDLFWTMESFYKYFVYLLANTCACVVYFKLCQFRLVDCTRGTAFGLSIGTMKDAIKYADSERFTFINSGNTTQQQQLQQQNSQAPAMKPAIKYADPKRLDSINTGNADDSQMPQQPQLQNSQPATDNWIQVSKRTKNQKHNSQKLI